MKQVATVDNLLKLHKLVECICLLTSWTSAVDEYHLATISGKLQHLFLFVTVALMAWFFTIMWLILTFTKVYARMQIAPKIDALIHTIVAAFIIAASLMVLKELHNVTIDDITISIADQPGPKLALVSAILLIMDSLISLFVKRTTAS